VLLFYAQQNLVAASLVETPATTRTTTATDDADMLEEKNTSLPKEDGLFRCMNPSLDPPLPMASSTAATSDATPISERNSANRRSRRRATMNEKQKQQQQQQQQRITHLVNMGFEYNKAIKALEQTNYNLEAALDYMSNITTDGSSTTTTSKYDDAEGNLNTTTDNDLSDLPRTSTINESEEGGGFVAIGQEENEMALQSLVGMGFPPSLVFDTLQRTSNNLGAALDILIRLTTGS
jgi:hypothetical protein